MGRIYPAADSVQNRVTACDHPMEMGGHHLHLHGPADGSGANADGRRLWIALALILSFMAVEVVVGILAASLALLSDAAHMLTDAGAIALAILAARLARRPAGGGFTFGMRRAEILSAQLNGATLLALGAVIVLEGVAQAHLASRRGGRRSCWWSPWPGSR